MKCYIKGYDKSKYEADAEKVFQYDLEGVESFEVVQGEEFLPQKVTEKDPHDEYLVIYLEAGYPITYLNSLTDIFKY